MSSINSSDSGDDVKKLREHYETREKELKSKHAKEKEKLSSVYKDDVKKIRTENSESEKARSKDQKTAISRKDMKFTNDMEKLKTMHEKQVKAQMTQQAMEKEKLRKAYKEDVQRNDKTLRNVINEKDNAHKKVLSEQQQAFEDSLSRTSETSKRDIMQRKEELKAHYENKEDVLREKQIEEYGNLTSEYADYRAQKEREVKKKDRSHETDRRQFQENQAYLLAQKDKENSEILKDMREESIHGVEREKRMMRKYIEKEQKALDRVKEDLEAGHNTDSVKNLKYKLDELKKDNIRDKNRMERAKKREVENTKIAYQDNIDKLQEEKLNQLKIHNKMRGEQISEVQNRSNEQLKNSHDFFNEQLRDEADNHDAKIARLDRVYSKKSIEDNQKIDNRFRQVKYDYEKDRTTLEKQHNKNLAALKAEQEKILLNERFGHVNERQSMQERFEANVQDMQARHERDMQKMKENYDNTLTQLQADFEGKLADVHNHYQGRNAEKELNKENELRQQQARYDYKLKKIEDAYSENSKRAHKTESISFVHDKKNTKGKYA